MEADLSVKYLGPVEIKNIANSLNMRPTKTLGQNFVHDPNTIKMIVEKAELSAADVVLEVGPGLGSLTLGILATGAQVVGVEIDSKLAEQLPKTVDNYAHQLANNLIVINKNALKLTSEELANSSRIVAPPTRLVANLPYNVAVPILIHILKNFPSIKQLLIMVQQEVAQRIVAAPGTKVYGIPSVKTAFFGKANLIGKVSKTVFWPVPKVESSLVNIVRYPTTSWRQDREFQESVFSLIEVAFGQRRKSLRAALNSRIKSKDFLDKLLELAELSPQRRGETLTIQEYVQLATIYGQLSAHV